MKLIDVTTITKQLVAEVLGTTYMEQNGYLEAIPAEKLVDIGKDVTDTVATTERAINSMIVLLTRHEIEVADYAKLFGSIQVTREEWGGFIERTKLKIADIMEVLFAIGKKYGYSEDEVLGRRNEKRDYKL